MFTLPNKYILLQANFNPRRSGLLGQIYYTIYNADGSIYLARTNSNVVEYGDGSYGITTYFSSEGNYSIFWQYNNTYIIASEDINVFDFSGQSIARYDSYGL